MYLMEVYPLPSNVKRRTMHSHLQAIICEIIIIDVVKR